MYSLKKVLSVKPNELTISNPFIVLHKSPPPPTPRTENIHAFLKTDTISKVESVVKAILL